MAPWNEALAEFELDPRGKPEFTPVFIQQEHLAATVGITVWFHTIYLLYILSSVNHIYGKSRAYIYEIDNFTVLPTLIRMVKSKMIGLLFIVVIPIQFSLAICGTIVFGFQR